jgi:hypothetical protein
MGRLSMELTGTAFLMGVDVRLRRISEQSVPSLPSLKLNFSEDSDFRSRSPVWA